MRTVQEVEWRKGLSTDASWPKAIGESCIEEAARPAVGDPVMSASKSMKISLKVIIEDQSTLRRAFMIVL